MAQGAIGDYIHARYRNYVLYGLGRNYSKNPPSPTRIAQEQKEAMYRELINQRITKGITQQKIQALEEQINTYFTYRNNEKNNKSNSYEQEFVKTINEALSGIWGSSAIDFNRMVGLRTFEDFANLIGKSTTEIEATLKRYQRANQDQNRRYSVIKNKIKFFANAWESIKANSSGSNFFSGARKSRLMRDLEILDKQWLQIETALYDSNNSIELNRGNLSYKDSIAPTASLDPTRTQKRATTGRNIIQVINDIMKNLLGGYITMITGYIGELIPALTMYLLAKKGQAETDELMQMVIDPIMNKQRSKNVELTTNFSPLFRIDQVEIDNQKAKWLETHPTLKGIKYFQSDHLQLMETEDLVDITVLSPDDNQPYNMSVKNVNFYSGYNVSIRTGTNILTLVQDYALFLNHFLNVVGGDEGFQGNYAAIWGQDIANAKTIPSNAEVQAMKEAMKLTIFVRSLVGGIWTEGGQKSDIADFFVIRDNSALNGYKIYAVDELYLTVAKNLQKLKVEGFPWQDANYFRDANEWQGTIAPDWKNASARITNLINSLRVISYHVSIDPKGIFYTPK